MRKLLVLFVAACTATEDPMPDAAFDDDTALPPDAQPGDPIDATPGAWTWVGFPDAVCDDGTATGIGVNPGTTSDVFIYMNGGGACWDFDTCARFNTSIHGPFGPAQFDAMRGTLATAFWNRDDVDNPFRTWTFVVVPYCTGDMHAGASVMTYTSGSDSRTIHHMGHANLEAYLARLVPTFPTPSRIVVAGQSAGGGGAALTYPRFRAAWPAPTKMYLVNDSLPLLVGDDASPALRAAWRTSWGLDDTVFTGVCADCADDLSRFYARIAARHPDDRIAVMSTMEDLLIRTLYWLPPQDFSAALVRLRDDVLSAQPHTRTYFAAGFGHTFTGDPNITVNGITVKRWLADMVTDDAAWASVRP